MDNRTSTYPGRYAVLDDHGNFVKYVQLVRADEPTVPGTPLDKAHLFADDTEAKYPSGSVVCVNDALNFLGNMNLYQWRKYDPASGVGEIVMSLERNAYPDYGNLHGFEYTFLGCPLDNATGNSRLYIGSYKGTGKTGSRSNRNTLYFSGPVQMVMLFGVGLRPNAIRKGNLVVMARNSSHYLTYTADETGLAVGGYNPANIAHVEWEDKEDTKSSHSVSWFCNGNDYYPVDPPHDYDRNVYFQMNAANETYHYIAFAY